MRTTVTLDPDIVAALEAIRRERGVGPSEALNELARRGLIRDSARTPYVHRSRPMGARVDVTNTAEVLELLDEWDERGSSPPPDAESTSKRGPGHRAR